MNVYCTLFDSNYLDKGLVLYRSLCQHEASFRLYVFAFDDRCRDILLAEKLEHMVVVSLAEFETPALLKVKAERTQAEYCWTCTPWTIRYVLDYYQEEHCTYIDADMMFFSSPQYIFDDMREKGCSTLITPHRFPNTSEWKKREKLVGTYCVEFNSFLNNDQGRQVLDWWAEQCLNWCFYTHSPNDPGYGDQRYLNEFSSHFPGVYICEEWGAGIAGWNAAQLRLSEKKNGIDQVELISTGKTYPIVFYHFSGIAHLTRTWVNVNSGVPDARLHKVLYDTYMSEIRAARRHLLKCYELELYVRRRLTNRGLYAFYQRFLAPVLHIRRLSDLYRI